MFHPEYNFVMIRFVKMNVTDVIRWLTAIHSPAHGRYYCSIVLNGRNGCVCGYECGYSKPDTMAKCNSHSCPVCESKKLIKIIMFFDYKLKCIT